VTSKFAKKIDFVRP